MAESTEIVEVEAIEEAAHEERPPDAEVRRLPERRPTTELDPWRGDARTVAIAAAGGIAAGAATVAAVSAVKARVGGRRSRSRAPARRRGREREGIIASRSFLIDIHVLGR